jgi:D-alanyl-D-alanine carboxypeptidase
MVSLTTALPVAAAPAISGIVSEAYIVMDAKTGQVLISYNAKKPMYPASITKILTSALVLERGNPADTVTVSNEAVFSIPRNTTHIALTEGEIITVNDLLGSVMVESANDAANSLAEYISGTQKDFADLMNVRAKEIGATASNFVNANGLYDPNHVTTAYDMALITKWALEIDGFRELFGAEEWVIQPTNKQKEIRKYGTHHHMLVTSKFYYEGTIGGKLGWTPESKHTLVTAAKRNNIELICVVLKTDDQYDKYRDAAKLLDESFAEYKSVSFADAYFQYDSVPLYENGNCVGEIEIIPSEISFLRPSTLAKADIKIDMTIPEKFETGNITLPIVRFTKPDGSILYETTLGIKQHKIAENAAIGLLSANDQLEKPKTYLTPDWLKPWMCFLTAFFFLAVALLFAVRANNLAKRRKKMAARKAGGQSETYNRSRMKKM